MTTSFMKNIKSYLTVVVALLVFGAGATSAADAKKPKKDRALERTRDQVKMLDDVYKTTVVLITQAYVEDESSFPAGKAAKMLFKAIKEKGHHEVKILDASGEPYSQRNVAKDEFDKAAVKALLGGKDWYEKVEKQGKKRFLRAATPIPVVMQKCVLCHENYKSVKEGQPIGLLSYTIEIK